MPRTTRQLAILILLCLCPSPAVAQEGALRASRDPLRGFHDTVATTTSVDSLRGLLAGISGADAPALVRRGLVGVRLYQLTQDRAHVESADEVLEAAVERAPEDPWTHYARGLYYSRGPALRISTPFGVLERIVAVEVIAAAVGRDHGSRAMESFARALALDPAFTLAAIEWAGLALRAPDNKEDLTRARDALRTALRRDRDADPSALILLADVEAMLSDLYASIQAADSAAARGADASSALHARAVALLRQAGGEKEGEQVYFAGVDRLSPVGADRYFADLVPIASRTETLRWRRIDLPEKQRSLRAFWETRAALWGVTTAERLAEHYRRVAFATRAYLRHGRRNVRPPGAMILDSADQRLAFDDRGIMYIRHGEPDSIIRTIASDLAQNETWIYTGTNRPVGLFHFMRRDLDADFVLVDQIPCHPAYIADRVLFDARLQQLALGCDRLGQLSLASELRRATLRSLRGESDRTGFAEMLPFFYDIYTFRGENGRTDVTAAVAIPGNRLRPVDTGEAILYGVNLSFVVVDTVKRQVARVDTTYWARSPRALGPNELLRIELDISSLPTSGALHRILVRNAAEESHGTMYGGPQEIRNYDVPGLMLSDIVLAEPEARGDWRRGDATLGLVAPQQFPAGEFTVFYEIYNLKPSTRYRTEIIVEKPGSALRAITRMLGLSGPAIKLQFEGESPATTTGVVQEIRRVEADLEPGRYRMEIRVVNLASGESARRERMFVVPENE